MDHGVPLLERGPTACRWRRAAVCASAALFLARPAGAQALSGLVIPPTVRLIDVVSTVPLEEGDDLRLLKGIEFGDEAGGGEPGIHFDPIDLRVAVESAPEAPLVDLSELRGSPLRHWGAAAVIALSVGYSLQNSMSEPTPKGVDFHETTEGFFGRSTYTGGADKAAHFVDYSMAARLFETTYQRFGYSDGTSRWLAFGTAVGTGLATEVGDGTTLFGFSWEDFLMDALGAASAMGLSASGWDDTFGFRFGTFVSQHHYADCCPDTGRYGRDYSGEIYTADVKLAGAARRLKLDVGPARYLLFSMTYGTNGYRHAPAELQQRLVGFEIGIHFTEILRSLRVPREPLWGEVLYTFFDMIRLPYTAIGVRYDLNHDQWFGPTAGRTASSMLRSH
jgi:hypothetical protein